MANASSQQPFVCTQCVGFQAPTFQLLLSHAVRVHSGNFRITCCMREYKTVSSYRKHCQRSHQQIRLRADLRGDSNPPDDDTQLGDQPEDDTEENSRDKLECDRKMRNNAQWILKSKETLKLTQVATNTLLDSVTELCTSTVIELGEEVKALLQSSGVDPSSINGLEVLFSLTSPYCRPFDGIDTYHRQLAYYKEHLNFVV